MPKVSFQKINDDLTSPTTSVDDRQARSYGSDLARQVEYIIGEEEQKEVREATLAAQEDDEDEAHTLKLSKSARAYAKTYKPGPPLVPAIIVDRITQYISKVNVRKRGDFLPMVCKYWSLKREARRGAPLLKRLRLEPWTAVSSGKLQSEEDSAYHDEAGIKIENNTALSAFVIGDLEPPLELVELLFSLDAIKDESHLILNTDPLSSLLSFEFPVFKPPPPPLEKPRKAPKLKLPKLDRTEESKRGKSKKADDRAIRTEMEPAGIPDERLVIRTRRSITAARAALRTESTPLEEELAETVFPLSDPNAPGPSRSRLSSEMPSVPEFRDDVDNQASTLDGFYHLTRSGELERQYRVLRNYCLYILDGHRSPIGSFRQEVNAND
ncbi:hypothetical protein BT96DRAFT_1038487 [Gymnopus androsaceus JB14]|uniref:Uncharacterized protein n=1 Tax=Gymnopus androsaceus JB14 TaxID=1447944 RepID=A0A6A4HES0_9AGAR|nr:hypothetical protein BT96DRAFT_1038487 [Gymnopus androsaceus JB14]